MTTKLLQIMGFDGIPDFFGKYYPLLSGVFSFSLTFGAVTGAIEAHSGISILLWVFFAASTIFDLCFGTYVNVGFLKQEFDSTKFFRGIFKPFVMFVVIFLTNTFKKGLLDSNIDPEFLETTLIYITATMHYSFVATIGVFTLLSIAENAAKYGIPTAVTLVKILNMKIKKIEELNEKTE